MGCAVGFAVGCTSSVLSPGLNLRNLSSSSSSWPSLGFHSLSTSLTTFSSNSSSVIFGGVPAGMLGSGSGG